MDTLPEIILNAPGSGRAAIKLHGAHVTSWQTASGREMLFLSEKAMFKPGSAIRGGVPIVFPQFSNRGSLPKHGFARTESWMLTQEYPNKAEFTLKSNDSTTQSWPHLFEANYTVSVEKDSLSLLLTIKNTGDQPFEFTSALHTYFRVDDFRGVQISGLDGVEYIDEAVNPAVSKKQVGNLLIDGEVDRIYINPPGPIDLTSNHGAVRISANGFCDTVVWNPGELKASQIPDINSTEYCHFVCIESAVITKPVKLDKGESWSGTQKLTTKLFTNEKRNND